MWVCEKSLEFVGKEYENKEFKRKQKLYLLFSHMYLEANFRNRILV